MPQLIAAIPALLVAPVGVSSLSVGFGVALEFGLPTFIASGTVLTAGAVGRIAVSLALSVASNLLFSPDKPTVPRPEDGKYNLRQSVPSLVVILGEDMKGADYFLLEEKDGVAVHGLCHAAHECEAYVEHWLHDEPVTLDGGGVVTSPTHFDGKVKIFTRLGLDAETAYSEAIDALPPGLWTADHRGDGLATALMLVESVSASNYQKVFPQQMPAHRARIKGAKVYDPRSETTAWTKNLALLRLHHLIKPFGCKLTLTEIHLPDWENAADVCDEEVTNKQAGTESRYHGGFWFRYNNDPVEIGRTMDHAAEMVLYETDEGKIGVHAGEFVTPDIRLTDDDIIRLDYDANEGLATTVLAVRGRYKDPAKNFNMVDAAIHGDPYGVLDDNTERTKTVENVAVQSHNHIQRLQTIAKIRANAPRVHVTAHYEPAENVFYRRFVTVHRPARGLDEAVVEIINRPKLSLRNLTIEFDGIVVPSTLYNFVAVTQEGDPPADVTAVEAADIPVPENFDIAIEINPIVDNDAAVAVATWDFVNAALLYELEYDSQTSGIAVQSVISKDGDTDITTPPLIDGVEYRFRLRTWSSGTSSDWTSYELRTIAVDLVAPFPVSSVNADDSEPTVVTLTWNTPFSANYHAARIYRHTADDFGAATRIATVGGFPSSSGGYVNTGIAAGTYYYWVVAINASGVEATAIATGAMSVVGPELITNGTFDADSDWTKGTDWSIGSGVATKAAGTGSSLSQAISLTAGRDYEVTFTVTSVAAGSIAPQLASGTPVDGTSRSTAATFTETLTAVSGNDALALVADASFDGSIDSVSVRELP